MANWIPLWLHKLSSPPVFYRFAGSLRPWAIALALVLWFSRPPFGSAGGGMGH
jgi:hypothetical protein